MQKASKTQLINALHQNHEKISRKNMRTLFAEDPERFRSFSLKDNDLLFDWSKCCVDHETMSLLRDLGKLAGLESARDAMFSGVPINTTENRAVLHTALRNLKGEGMFPHDEEFRHGMSYTLTAMEVFSDKVRSGKLPGFEEKIEDVVNIGIGGSDLGTAMAVQALAPYHDGPRVHHVSNVDSAHVQDTLSRLVPKRTLFILISKTFLTMETRVNAQTAYRWTQQALGEERAGNHFAAVSANLEKAHAFGIRKDHVFRWDQSVGGRYSLWSAAGLPLMLAIGKENFRMFLSGARQIDEHFLSRSFPANIPVIAGLIGYWQRVVCKYPTRAVIPYDQRLARLPAYLQQLEMESNGKSVNRQGYAVETPTGPVIWGATGTDGQHAFFQFLHQGTDITPVEFLVGAKGHESELDHQHELLLANCFAQSEALMRGRYPEELITSLHSRAGFQKGQEKLVPFLVSQGGRPSLTILYEKLDPHTLGRLIALFEHRVFVEGILYDINSFDQWGVEFGKELAEDLLPFLRESRSDQDWHQSSYSSSTQGLVNHLLALQGKNKN